MTFLLAPVTGLVAVGGVYATVGYDNLIANGSPRWGKTVPESNL